MDQRNDIERNEGSESPGMICKAATLEGATLEGATLEEADIAKINKYTLEPLTAEQVFVFKATLCDNEIDRHSEHFTLSALRDLKKLFVGKTVIKDHYRTADGQVARIYETQLLTDETALTATGENYTKLIAKCYMVRTEGNADLIAEIKAGIKKEGSVGCSVKHALCSICGTDNVQTYCLHWPGRSYNKDGGAAVCTFKLDGAKDAYEFSLVAVPAQRAAGISKSYTGKPFVGQGEKPDDSEQAKTLALRARIGAVKAKNTRNT